MLNAFAQPQRILVLGGSSQIAAAIVQELASTGLTEVVLAGPRPERLAPTAASLSESTNAEVTVHEFDAAQPHTHAAQLADCFKRTIDIVILAFGVLGDQNEYEAAPQAAVAAARPGLLVSSLPPTRAQGRTTSVRPQSKDLASLFSFPDDFKPC